VSESEPPLRCRNDKSDVKTGVTACPQDKHRGKPAYCLCGVRHKGGTTLNQALVRNEGTCCMMQRENPIRGRPHEGGKYRGMQQGRMIP
jgi:hypothetical protein